MRVALNKNDPTEPLLTSLDAAKDIANCLFIHGIKTEESSGHSGLAGNLQADQGKGIFHFLAGGPDRGILKSIKFTETKSDAYTTALIRRSQAGDASAAIIRPSKFNVKMSLIGNPFFSIGQLFYVDTTLIDGGYFVKENLSFGGYYFTNAVDTYIGPDKYVTEVNGTLEISDRAARGLEMVARQILTPLEYSLQTNPPAADIMNRINQLSGENQNQRNLVLEAYYRNPEAVKAELLAAGSTESVASAPEQHLIRQSITDLNETSSDLQAQQYRQERGQQEGESYVDELARSRAALSRATTAGWSQTIAPSGARYWTHPDQRGSLTDEQIQERYMNEGSE